MIAATQIRRALRKTLSESDVFLLKESVFRNANPAAARYIAGITGIEIPLYMRSKKVLFIHVPRTGGTSVAIALYGHKTDHHSAAYYRAIDRAAFLACFKFTFVRNPWDRLVSAYHLLRRGHTEYVRVWSPRKYAELRKMSFNDFVQVWLWKRKDQLMQLDTTLWSQTYFTHSPGGELLVDFIGRCENLEQDLLRLSDQWSMSIQNIHLNQSTNRENKSYRFYYSNDDAIDTVAKIYAQDISVFGYEF